MSKIYEREINYCSECPFFKVSQVYFESLYFCMAKVKKMDYEGTAMIIPNWCPLPDKENNKCTCEKCTGIEVESTYEKVEKVVKAIEEKGKRQADFDRHKTDIL